MTNNKVYIAVLSRIESITDRITFSVVINDFIETLSPDLLPDEKELETGIMLKPYQINAGIFCNGRFVHDNRAITLYFRWIEYLKTNNMWMPWMDNWTDGTLYLMYSNNETM